MGTAVIHAPTATGATGLDSGATATTGSGRTKAGAHARRQEEGRPEAEEGGEEEGGAQAEGGQEAGPPEGRQEKAREAEGGEAEEDGAEAEEGSRQEAPLEDFHLSRNDLARARGDGLQLRALDGFDPCISRWARD